MFDNGTHSADAPQAGSPIQLLALDEFEPAFPMSPRNTDALDRRFRTLYVERSSLVRTGGNAAVCRAHNAAGETLGIKRPWPIWEDMDPDRAAQTRNVVISILREEYRAQRAVSLLRGFARPLGFGLAGGAPLIVMEWVEGVTLRRAAPSLPHELDRDGRDLGCTGETVSSLGIAVLRTLIAADRLYPGLAHRDISSRNIMLRTESRTVAAQAASCDFDVCLIDLGSAAVPDPNLPSFTALTGVARRGTPEYAPPEMLARDLPNATELRRSHKVDVYALCSVLYELYCGHTPYRLAAEPDTDPYQAKIGRPLPTLAPHMPEEQELCDAIVSGISIAQDSRPSAERLLHRLEAYQENCPVRSGAHAVALSADALADGPAAQDELAGTTDCTVMAVNGTGAPLGYAPGTSPDAIFGTSPDASSSSPFGASPDTSAPSYGSSSMATLPSLTPDM